MSFSEVQLGDLIRIKHGFAFKSDLFREQGKYVILTPGHFFETGGFRDRPDKDRFYAGDVPEDFILPKRSLIIAMTEQGPGLLGSGALVPEEDTYLHNQRIGLVTITEPGRIDAEYLYRLFNSRGVRAQINASASGTKVRHTAPERVYRVKASIPPLGVQRKIASTVAQYDALIDNNRRRIALLEHAARLLYEEWFVRFRFPGYERAKFINGLPVGWSPVEVSRLCSDVREHVNPEVVNPEMAYIGLEHLPRRSITLMDWGQADEVTSSKFRFQAGDILFGKIRPYFHKVGFALTDGITSSDAIVIRPVEERLFCYCLSLLSSDGFVALASKTVKEGSKMPRADWKYLGSLIFTFPPESLLNHFNSIVAPLLEQLKTLASEIKKATAARNLLLPRLMSGEVEV
jgi:type I restriction enzyme, S subunit